MINATLTKFPGESDQFYFDCTDILAVDDVIIGTPTISYLPSGLVGGEQLAFSAISVSDRDILFPDGRRALIGKVIVLTIAGGAPISATVEREYTVLASFGTQAGNTKIARGRLLLLPLAL